MEEQGPERSRERIVVATAHGESVEQVAMRLAGELCEIEMLRFANPGARIGTRLIPLLRKWE